MIALESVPVVGKPILFPLAGLVQQVWGFSRTTWGWQSVGPFGVVCKAGIDSWMVSAEWKCARTDTD